MTFRPSKFLSCLINWGLFGALSIQACKVGIVSARNATESESIVVVWYYLAFPNDARFIKLLVTFVYLVEAAQTFIVTSDCFNIYARHFGTLEALNLVQTEWLAAPTITAIGGCSAIDPLYIQYHAAQHTYTVSCVVQIFYAYRIWILSKRRAPAVGICVVRDHPVTGVRSPLSYCPARIDAVHCRSTYRSQMLSGQIFLRYSTSSPLFRTCKLIAW